MKRIPKQPCIMIIYFHSISKIYISYRISLLVVLANYGIVIFLYQLLLRIRNILFGVDSNHPLGEMFLMKKIILGPGPRKTYP